MVRYVAVCGFQRARNRQAIEGRIMGDISYTVKDVEGKKELKALYKGSALAFEGVLPSDENLSTIVAWLQDQGAEPADHLVFEVVRGALMNRVYRLKGAAAYPAEFAIVCLSLDELGDPERIYASRSEIGGRWFDDIVDNLR